MPGVITRAARFSPRRSSRPRAPPLPRSAAPSAPATPVCAVRLSASTADFGEAKAAHTPSPVCLNIKPPCASIAARNTSSWAARAARIASASASHRRVEPSISVNKNVTTPEGGCPGDTRTGCHTKPTTTPQTATDFRDSRKSSIWRQGPPLQDSRFDVLEHCFRYPFGVTGRPVRFTRARSGIHVGYVAGAGFDDDILLRSQSLRLANPVVALRLSRRLVLSSAHLAAVGNGSRRLSARLCWSEHFGMRNPIPWQGFDISHRSRRHSGEQ